MSNSSSNKNRNSGRWALVGIFVLFFGPVMLAWLLNVETPSWLPSAKTNHGDLIDPPLSFPTAGLHPVDVATVPDQLLRGKWTLLYAAPSACLANCDRATYRMRQVRHALGKDMQRIQRLLVTASDDVDEVRRRVRQYDTSIAIVAARADWFERATFLRPDIEIYLIDPQGYLILSYAEGADPSGVIKDLKRLLKISKVG